MEIFGALQKAVLHSVLTLALTLVVLYSHHVINI